MVECLGVKDHLNLSFHRHKTSRFKMDYLTVLKQKVSSSTLVNVFSSAVRCF